MSQAKRGKHHARTDKSGRTKGTKKVEEPKEPNHAEQEVKEVFEKFDVDHSGTVSVGELRQMLQLLGQNPTESEVETIVDQFDDNHNGQLELDEFQELMKSVLKDEDERDAEMRNAFAVFDKDDSGFIDRTELAMVLQLTGEKLNRNEIDTVFNTIDANGDGMINYEEFSAAMKSGGLLGGD